MDTDDGDRIYVYDTGAWQDAQDNLVATSITNAATAQATADGKITTFIAISAPTAEGEGDFWIDSDDNNTLYRSTAAGAASWVNVQDGTIAVAQSAADAAQADATQALVDAAAAQAGADGKIQSFYQAAQPSGVGEAEGDIWVDTDDGDRIYVYDTGAWQDAQDNLVATAITNAASAQSTADGKIATFLSTTAPTAEGEGDFWIDTDDNNRLYRAGAAGAGSWVDYNITALGADGLTTLTSSAAVVGDTSTLGEVGGAFYGLGAYACYGQGTASGASPGTGIAGIGIGLNSRGGYFWTTGATARAALLVSGYISNLGLEVSSGTSEFNNNIDILNVGQIQTNGGFDTTRAIETTSTATGTMVCDGGFGLVKSLYLGGILHATNSTDSTSDTTGGARFGGGVGIVKSLWVGGSCSFGDASTDNIAIGGATLTGNSNVCIKEGAAGTRTNNQIQLYAQLSTTASKSTFGIVSEQGTIATSGSITTSGAFAVHNCYPTWINGAEWFIPLSAVT